MQQNQIFSVNSLISASLENLAVQRTNVLSASSPDVTAQQRMVLTTLEYVSSGVALMTL